MNDLTTERLQLENDSNLQVRKLKEDRVAEMIDINTRRYRKYNQQRLQSDQKEATLTKMIFELEALQSAKAREEKSSKVEDLASQRLDEVKEELELQERFMHEAVDYTDTLKMMTQRLNVDIMQRRKLQHEMERALNEAKVNLNVAATHSRTIVAGERTARGQVEKFEAHRQQKRAVQSDQMERRKMMAQALAEGWRGRMARISSPATPPPSSRVRIV